MVKAKTAREIAEELASPNEAEIWANTERSRGFEQGFAEGFAESFSESFAEGFEQGFAEGRAKADIKIAKNMLNLNFDIEKISEYTGLTLEKLEKLKKELK